jgi:hypothetical protein
MTTDEFYKHLQRRLAQTTIGAPALRGQGGGLVAICRTYCEHRIQPEIFFRCLKSEPLFKGFLNRHTHQLMRKFPQECRDNFGAARKALNLFFRELAYNKYFCDYYHLSADPPKNHCELAWLEIPLDSHVASAIHERFPNLPLRWNSIRRLTKRQNKIYQEHAQFIALSEGVARIHLDMVFWRRSVL